LYFSRFGNLPQNLFLWAVKMLPSHPFPVRSIIGISDAEITKADPGSWERGGAGHFTLKIHGQFQICFQNSKISRSISKFFANKRGWVAPESPLDNPLLHGDYMPSHPYRGCVAQKEICNILIPKLGKFTSNKWEKITFITEMLTKFAPILLKC
jgi:hypothetical protein